MEDPGLGLTREEIETLFDIVDEGDWGPANRKVSGGADDGDGIGNGGDPNATWHSRPGVRRADRGLILFLRKRGLRRREYWTQVQPDRDFRDLDGCGFACFGTQL